MDTFLSRAPFDRPLVLSDIKDPDLEMLLARLGLFKGHTFVRENEEVLLQPVRIRCASGDVVLGGGMAMRIIVHLDDGRRIPLTDMAAGMEGHLEGTTCSPQLLKALDVLGVRLDERITYLRQLPPMDYTVWIGEEKKERIQEGMAAKIWGRTGGQRLQFVLVGQGQPFVVEQILGGRRAARALAEKGIVPDQTIRLETVAPAQIVAMAGNEPVVITTDDGLHLHLRPGQAGRILVTPQ